MLGGERLDRFRVLWDQVGSPFDAVSAARMIGQREVVQNFTGGLSCENARWNCQTHRIALGVPPRSGGIAVLEPGRVLE